MEDAGPEMLSIFAGAVERPSPEGRAAFLDAACGADAALRRRIEGLLAAHNEAGGFLRDTPVGNDPVATTDQPVDEGPGAVIGSYKLLEQIGEGGFGVVFMAEQTHPVRRKVALKVLKPGMDTRQVVARFEAERQALAIMDHPNIAKVLDGGTTPSGRLYFVMELVKGVPITDFCDQNHLTPRQRLELFVSVCQAVQHAHQKGIIHRDIKPSNVLVTVHDTAPVVKVIDFGVAKALGQVLTDKTLFTAFAQMVGTPLYMSPEQAGQSGLDVDTRSDIYSLGVLLYELLTGTTPFDKDRFKKAPYDEIRRIIREEEPPKPSTRLSDLSRSGDTTRTGGAGHTSSLASVSASRHTEPAKLTRLFRGEVDWIVMKALEKDRNRRYETANGFAADVQRYLNDETVQACPPSAGYRFRKFARRNRRALVTASVIGVALLVGMGAVAGSLGWVVRDREAGRVRTAGEVNQFLQRAESLYADNKLPEATAEVQKARGVLEAGRGDEELARRVRQWLTDLDTAAELEEIRLESFDQNDRSWGHIDYARVFREYGIDVEALSVEEATARVAASRIRSDLLFALVNWAGKLRTDPQQQDPARWQRLFAIHLAAEPDPWQLRLFAAVKAKDVKALRELADGADLVGLRARTLAHVGHSLVMAGDAEAAVAFLSRVQRQYPGDFLINSTLALSLSQLKPPQWDEEIAFRRVALGARPQSAWAHNTLAIALARNDRREEAIVEYREALRLMPGYAHAHHNLGNTLQRQKRLDEAIACYKKAIELDPKYAWAHNSLGVALKQKGELGNAIAAYKKAVELDPKYALPHLNLGVALDDQANLDEAIACYKKAIELDPKYALAHYNLGLALRRQSKLDEAITNYKKAIELDPKYANAHLALGIALERQSKLDEAIANYKKAVELEPKNAHAHHNLGYALHQKKRPEAIASYKTAIELDPKNADAHYNLGLALHDQGKLDDAIVCYRKAIELDPTYLLAHNNLGLVLRHQSKLDEAIACYKRAIEIDPQHTSAHMNLGNALRAQKKLDEAITSFRKAIALDPKSAPAHYNLSGPLRDQKKHDEAAACLRIAIQLDPKYVNAHLRLGQTLFDQRKVVEAIACYQTAIELDPNNPNAHNSLGIALRRQGKLDEAIACYKKAIELDPKNAAAHFNLGVSLYDQKKWDEAIACFRTVIELDPKNANAHSWLGDALADQGQVAEAIAAYRKAIELDPKNAATHNNLGLALAKKGLVEEAIASYREAIRHEPDFILAHRNWAWLVAAGPDRKYWDGKRAVELATRLVELAPKDNRNWTLLGAAHYRAGNWKESLVALQKSMEVSKGGFSIDWLLLAMVHWQQGDKDEARKWYDRAVEWMEQNATKNEDLRSVRLRREAAELMGIGKKKD